MQDRTTHHDHPRDVSGGPDGQSPAPTVPLAAPIAGSAGAPVDTEALRSFARDWAGARVGLLYGPMSAEDRTYIEQAPQGVSLTAVLGSLQRQGFDAVHIDPSTDGWLDAVKGCDVLFVNMHGEYGEDGRLQGLLDYLGKPYTGSGVLAGAIGLNKVMFKRVITAAGLPAPRSAAWGPVRHGELGAFALADVNVPLMVKQVSGGSSLGMQLLPDRAALTDFLAAAVAAGPTGEIPAEGGEEPAGEGFYLEQYVPGRSVTVAVVQVGAHLHASPPVEACFDGAFYDAATKMDGAEQGDLTYAVPDLPGAVTAGIQATALAVHELLGCRGFSRVDFIVQDDGTWTILEINTIPGMTPDGNFPTCLRHLGLTYDEAVLVMLHSAVPLSPHLSPGGPDRRRLNPDPSSSRRAGPRGASGGPAPPGRLRRCR